MKKDKWKIIITSLLIILLLVTSYITLEPTNLYLNQDLKYQQEYIIGKGNIKGEVNKEYFESKAKEFKIGANKYGYAVFKNPEKAFRKLKKDYKKGINLIQKENHLLPLTNFNYEKYGNYGWQVTTGTKIEQEQARFVSSFLDIYENSFKK